MSNIINNKQARIRYDDGYKLRMWELRNDPGTYFAAIVSHIMPPEWRVAFTIQRKRPRYVMAFSGEPVEIKSIVETPTCSGIKKTAIVVYGNGSTREVSMCDIIEGPAAWQRFRELERAGNRLRGFYADLPRRPCGGWGD